MTFDVVDDPRTGGYFGGVNYWWDHDYPRADQMNAQALKDTEQLGNGAHEAL